MPSREIDVLLASLDQAYDRKSWHGTNLKGSLRGVTPELASFRPGPRRHDIWELAVHAAYWKYVVRRRLLGEKRGSFPLKGSNWFVRPIERTAVAWRADLDLLEATHRSLREAVAALDPRELPRMPAGRKVSNLALITGAAAHDVYHAGQIQLLKRLAAGV
ncbi:MAG TPA: DinB family protein [Thermoanaerobaculia bacterium]|nr:DinB family protein [Thermoanaerobaculia bacterium]